VEDFVRRKMGETTRKIKVLTTKEFFFKNLMEIFLGEKKNLLP
jgi:hypothetical protein